MPELKNHVQDKEDRTMTEGTRCTGMSMTAFFAGLVAGIGTGLLLAPQSGARTRRQLHGLAKDLQEESNYMLGDAKTSLGKVFGQGKESCGVNDREMAT
jgi:gas vesicle protein